MAAKPSESGADEREAFAIAIPSMDVAPAVSAAPTMRRDSRFGITVSPTSASRAAGSFKRDVSNAFALEYERGTAFLLGVAVLGVGALTYYSLAREPGLLAITGGTLLAAVGARISRRRLLVHLAFVGLLLFLCGMLSAKVETWRAATDIVGGEISTRLTARVVSIDHQVSGRARLTLDVLATDRPHLRYAPTRVRLSARSLPQGIEAGSTITGIVRLLPPSGPVRPGGYDFAFKSFFDRIGASGFFLRGPELAVAAEPGGTPTFRQWVENARSGIADRIRARIGGAEGEIAAALILGVRGGIPEPVNEALRKTGLAHILSISGLHMALVAGIIMGAVRLSLALLPAFASRKPIKKYAAAIAIAATAAYLFVSGMEVAAVRSFLMLTVMLTAVLFDRAAMTMRNLAIAAALILVATPHEVQGPSFQMSFAATAALIGAYAAWSRRRDRRGNVQPVAEAGRVRIVAGKAGTFVLGLAATSIVAGLATTVFGVYHFQRVSPLTLAANLAVMPIVSFVVMPAGVLASFAMPLGLDGVFLDIMGKGIAAMMAIADWLARRSPLDAAGSIPAVAVLAFTAALVIAAIGTTWLRLAAIPLALVGLAAVAARDFPDVLVSEDGRLVAVSTGSGELAVNRTRPNLFTLENWARAMRSSKVVKPVISNSGSGIGLLEVQGMFSCDQALCLARSPSGHLVAHASSLDAARRVCGSADLLVLDDATVGRPCRGRSPVVITSRDLARSGSASVHFHAPPGRGSSEVAFAIERPYRPWHEHRRFSRAARGIAPYVRKPSPRVMPGASGQNKKDRVRPSDIIAPSPVSTHTAPGMVQ